MAEVVVKGFAKETQEANEFAKVLENIKIGLGGVEKVSTAVSTGFMAAQSAAALFGGESEKLAAGLLKVQQVTQLMQGLQAVLTGPLTPLKAISLVLGLVIAGFDLLSGWIDGLTEKFSGLKPIIDGVRNVLSKLTFGLVDDAETHALEKNIERLDEARQKTQAWSKSEEQRIRILKANGATAEEIYEAERAMLVKNMEATQALIRGLEQKGNLSKEQKEQLDALKLEYETMTADLAELDKSERDRKDAELKQKEDEEQQKREKQIGEAKRVAEENKKIRAGFEEEIKRSRQTELQNELDTLNEEVTEYIKAGGNKIEAEKYRKEQEDIIRDKYDEIQKQKEAELEKQLRDIKTANIADPRERELQVIQNSFADKIAAIKGQSEDEKNIRIELEKQRDEALKSARDKFAEEDKAKEFQARQDKITEMTAGREQELAQLQLDYDQKKISLEKFRAEQKKINEKWDKDEVQQAKARREAVLSFAETTLNGLTALGTIFTNNQKKQEKINKAAAVVQLAIDTARAISSAVASAKGATGFDYIAQIAIGVGAVLANIAKAKKLLSSAGESPAVDTSAPALTATAGQSSPGAPDLSAGSQRTLLDDAERRRSFNNQNIVVDAVVVETDMTQSQKEVAVANSRAKRKSR